MNRHERRAGLAFARRTDNEWHPFERVDTPEWLTVHGERWRRHADTAGDIIQAWRNNIYSVQVFARARVGAPAAMHLAIRRHDEAEVRGWSDLQRIKNEIAGEGRAAVEVYPPASDVIDQANMRHLFVLAEGERAPFTIQGRWR